MAQRFDGWGAFADHLDRVAFNLVDAPFEAAHIAAPLMADAVKEVFGHDPPLQTLADSTQAERAQLGYAPNEPLVRSGELRESVEHEADGTIAGMGSANFLAPIHEFGNAHIPPRPAFKIGFEIVHEYLQRLWSAIIGRAIRNVR
jgi:phage gpG-like protein